MKTLIAFFAVLTAEVTLAQAPAGTRIEFVTTRGRGCQNGEVAVSIAPDGRSFSVLMDNYKAEATASMTLEKRSCILEIGISAPRGWSYSLLSADYRGYVQAEAGTQVSHQVLYSFDGSRPRNENPGFENSQGRYSFKQQVFNGPRVEEYFIRNEIDPRVSLWSPCSPGTAQPLVIETFLIARAYSRGALAEISLDTVDGAIEQQFTWNWRQCSIGGGRTPPSDPRIPPGGGSGGRPPRFRP